MPELVLKQIPPDEPEQQGEEPSFNNEIRLQYERDQQDVARNYLQQREQDRRDAEQREKIDQIHAWLAEMMPMVRKANELMESKSKLLSWSFGGRK